MYHGGTEEHSTDVALDGDGNVWALTKADGCLNLYKNGDYVRSIGNDRDGNQDHFLSFHGKDLYIVTTLSSQKEVLVYKNNDVLYKVSNENGLRANSKPIFTKDGDLYFGAECSGKDKAYVYKNGKVLYTLDGSYIYRLFVLD